MYPTILLYTSHLVLFTMSIIFTIKFTKLKERIFIPKWIYTIPSLYQLALPWVVIIVPMLLMDELMALVMDCYAIRY